ncbi:MAG: dTDP-4-amino-4,6-dideoxy-D-galactose acyltransferase, partial [Enterobacterales bacterium]|nr:dTDP-4-amino-4,6-dideoxy-D-galactose acyltransferase [Enterobacterales bacterium]
MCVHASIEPLAWESEYFHLRTAKLAFSTAAPILTTADFQPFDIVQAKIPADRVALADDLANLGFRLVEGEIDLSLSIEKERLGTEPANSQTMPTSSRIASTEDIPWLRAQAAQAFALSRFRAPWYQTGDSARFYAEWVEKAVLGTFDHQC